MAMNPYRPTNDPLDRLWSTLMGPQGGYSRGEGLLRAPDTDVVETQNEIRVLVEMPGLKGGDIDLELENNVLTIAGEKKEQRTEGEEGTYHLSERRYGRFSRTFVLPRDVDQERIQASFEDGVLTVVIPKSEKARRRRIDVRGGGGGAQEVGTQGSGQGGGQGSGETAG